MLPPESYLHGQTVKAFIDMAAPETVEVVAILREGNVVMPEPETVLQRGDRLLILASRTARTTLKEHLAEAGVEAIRQAGHPRGGPMGSTV
jgi:Trk K+ transport system NAD-binding subunit